MKKLLINYVSAVSGGAVAYLKNITSYLLKLEETSATNDLNITILLNKKQLTYLPDNFDKSRLIVVENKTGAKRLIWEYLRLPVIVKENNIDVIFTPYQITRLIDNVVNVVMVRNMEPFTFHNYKYAFNTFLRNRLLKYQTIKTIKNAEKVIAVSSYVYEYIINNLHISENKLMQIYHGRDESFNPGKAIDDVDILASIGLTSSYIFTCGSILPYRKCEDIISAFHRCGNSNKFKLVVAGTGTDKNYASKLHELINKNKNIIMLGHVDHELMKVLFRNCHVFVTATETEACPNIAIEAMSSGCEILSSDVKPMPEMFKGTAVLYEHGNIEQLGQKLADYLNSPKQVNEFALKRAGEFSWEKCAKQTYNYLTN